ncbi:MAG: DSD1 family PLP-dependent enzyme [Clostridia bacterium]|nr:DSD1 family PLP-dependent enzyme [Clostridia bacterium]
MKIENISTPALIVNKSVFDKNAERMKELLKNSSLSLRPHYKSHKCATIAHKQIEDGAVGMTCAKLDEAIDLADCGIEDVLIANQITDKQKISRLAHLANVCRLTVCVDDKENVADIERAAELASSTVHCLIEYEIGMERCGVATKEDVAALAEFINQCPHLVFDGIQAYAGHLSHTVSETERLERTQANTEKIKELLNYLDGKGLHARTLSGGSTGTSLIKAKEGLYTELQAGSYLFMDSTYRELGLPFENSLFILTTVVSVNERLVVVDAGVKSCGVDQGMPVPVGFSVSHIVDSEEHLQLHNPSKQLKIGDKVLLIPAHCCSTVNLHDRLYLVEGDKVVDRLPVTARGCFH